MSIITEHPVASTFTGGLGFLLASALAVRRFGVECERAWLSSLAAPQEPFEAANDARAVRALARTATQPPTHATAREPIAA